MINNSRLLIQEPPLQVLPSLAVAVGLNEAIFLQQLHFRLLISKHLHDGFPWYYNTAEQWAEEFPFWSVPTIRRIINRLREIGIVLTSNAYNQMKIDTTLWYTIDYAALDSKRVITPCDQVDHSMLSDRSLATPIASDQLDHTNNLRKEVPTKSESATPGGLDASQDKFVASMFVKAYESIWGMMVPSPYIGDLIDQWSKRVAFDAFEYSLREAAKANKRNWKYLEGILTRVEVEGYTGQDKPSSPPPSTPDDDNDLRYLTELLHE